MPDPKAKTIDGTSFLISQPYEAGQTLGEAEAKALNQTRAENIGNNTRATIKQMKEEGKSESDIAAYVAGVDAEYVLTVSAVRSSAKLDPVEREAQKIARELVKNHLAQDGRKLTVAPEGETEESWAEKVEANIEKLAASEVVIAEAKKNVAAKQKQADKLSEAASAVKL